MTRLIFCCVLLLLYPAALVAQVAHRQFYEIDNLISRELIKNAIRDSSGYLWVATDAGILRYDGVETRRFSKGLPSPYTKAVLNSVSGNRS